MGGKNHLLDAGLLSELYRESSSFSKQAESGLVAIQKEMNKLSDILFRRGKIAIGEAGMSRETVLAMIDSMNELRDSIDKIQAFVETRLSDAVLMERETRTAARSKGAVVGGLQAEPYLKK